MDRQLKVTIKTEIKRGFADLSRQMGDLARAMKSIEQLQSSINRLADQFDRSNKIREAAKNTKALADNTKQYAGALKQVGQNPYDKLLKQVQELNAAQKAGAISVQQRAQAEIRALDQYIKKTNDLSIAQKKLRDSNGKFMSISPEARGYVNGRRPIYSEPAGPYNPYRYSSAIGPNRPPPGVNSNLYNYSIGPYQRSRRIRYSSPIGPQPFNPVNESLYGRPAGPSTATFEKFQSEQQRFSSLIERAYAENETRSNSWSRLLNKAYAENEQLDAKFSRLIQKAYTENESRDIKFSRLINGAYEENDRRNSRPPGGGSGGRGGGYGGGFGGRASGAEHESNAIAKLTESYNRFGRVLFQLQYSTLTLFSLSGIGLIMKTVDATTSLKNQLAFSAQNADQLKTNIDQVYKIANQTFAPTSAVAGVFSTIDKYRDTAHLSSDQVATITKGISGAFAASPGTAEEHAQAQYQFIQSIRSNRFGGDELRAVLEEAPGVGDILAREVGRLRGKKGPIDLRDSKHPVTRDEILKVFGDPRVVKEIYDTLAQRTRTFGDVLTLAKNRFDQYISKMETSNGLFGSLNNMLARFLQNDSAFDKFTKALEAATIAAATYATLSAGRAGVGFAKSVVGNIAGRLPFARNGFFGGMTNAEVSAMYAAANRENLSRNIVGFGGAAGRFVGGVGRGIAGAASGLRRNVIGATAAFAVDAGSALGSMGGAAAKGVADILTKASVALLDLGKAAFSVGGIISGVIVVVSLLAARFNFLLGKFGDGITIFDILGGLWSKMTVFLGNVASTLDKITGGVGSNFLGFIDKMLKKLIGAVKNDDDIRSKEMHRAYGLDFKTLASNTNFHAGGKLMINGKLQDVYTKTDANGDLVKGVLDKGKNVNGQVIGRVDAPKLFVYDAKSGRLVDTKQLAKPVDYLPTAQGHQYGTSEKAPGKPTRWDRFLLNLQNQAVEDSQLENAPEQMREIVKKNMDTWRQAANALGVKVRDLMNANTGALGEAHDKVAAALQVIDRYDIATATKKFFKTIDDKLANYQGAATEAGMRSNDAAIYKRKQDIMLSFLDGSPLLKSVTDEQKQSLKDEIIAGGSERVLLGGTDGSAPKTRLDRLKAMLPQASRDKLDDTLADAQDSFYREQHNATQNNLQIQKQQLIFNDQINASYGRRRDLVQAQTEIEARYFAQNKTRTFEQEADMEAEIKAAGDLFDQQTRYLQDWRKGAHEAFAQYIDDAKNTSKQTADLFNHAFSSIEQMFDDFIDTGRMNWKNFLLGMLQDFAKMEFRRNILSPLFKDVDALIPGKQDNSGNPIAEVTALLGEDSSSGNQSPGNALTQLAQNNPFTSMFKGFGSMFTNMFSGITGMLKNIMGPLMQGIGSIGSGIGSFIASILHSGGIAGEGSAKRAVPIGVFRNAVRYHTGGVAGLAPDEVPAILRKGERVLTSAQQAGMKHGSAAIHFNPQIEINYQAGDSNQSKSDAQEMGDSINSTMETKWQQLLLKESRPGGKLYGVLR